MKYIKIMCLVLSVILITGCGTKNEKTLDPVKNSVDTINSTKEKLSGVQAQLIISSVKLAYTKASMTTDNSHPTLKQVAEAFEMNNIEMSEDGTIKVDGKAVDCTTTTDNNNLKVSCDVNGTKEETTTDMPLSK